MAWFMLWILSVVTVVSGVPRLVCYFDAKAQYRTGNGKFNLGDVNPHLCTHLVYVSTSIYEVLSKSGRKFEPFVALRKKNPELKIMISVGNWSPEPPPTNQVIGPSTINTFSDSAQEYMRNLGVDGIDISWPWEPYTPNAKYKSYFVRQLNDLRIVLGQEFLISISASGDLSIAEDAYNIKKIDELVDFVNLKSYNLTRSTSTALDHHAPLYQRKWENDQVYTTSVDAVVKYWTNKGMSKSKINVGIPFFGKSWKLSSSAIYPPATASGLGDAGPLTNTPGLLAFHEICRAVRVDRTLKGIKNNDGKNGPLAYRERAAGSLWVGYDDPAMVKLKARYILENQLGGAVVWDLSMDDFRNDCSLGKSPLLTAVCSTLNIESCANRTSIPASQISTYF